MDTADYRELVDLLREQLRTVGAAELGDITLYSSRDTDTGDLQPVSLFRRRAAHNASPQGATSPHRRIA